MPGKKIILADGRNVVVDANRYDAFNSLHTSGQLSQIVSDGRPTKDAQEALAFLVSQLAYTETQTFEKLYLPMQYEQLLPISFEAGEYADSIRYEIYDYSGRGKRHNSRGRDIPKVDVAMADKSYPVLNGAIGYDYTTEELRRSAFLRRPINERKMMAAVEGYRRHMNDVGLFGELNSGITGLYNNALVPQGNAPVGAWNTGPKTPAQILSDVNALIQLVWTNTAYNDQITHIVMSPIKYAYIASTPRSDNSDKTILQYIKENNIAKVDSDIVVVFDLHCRARTWRRTSCSSIWKFAHWMRYIHQF